MCGPGSAPPRTGRAAPWPAWRTGSRSAGTSPRARRCTSSPSSPGCAARSETIRSASCSPRSRFCTDLLDRDVGAVGLHLVELEVVLELEAGALRLQHLVELELHEDVVLRARLVLEGLENMVDLEAL